MINYIRSFKIWEFRLKTCEFKFVGWPGTSCHTFCFIIFDFFFAFNIYEGGMLKISVNPWLQFNKIGFYLIVTLWLLIISL